MKKIFLISLLSLYACNQEINNPEIYQKINSNEPAKIIEGYYFIGEHHCTEFIADIFKNIDDQRISHDVKYKGISIYQAKMVALEKISGLKPSHKINYKHDAVVVEFYKEWARKERYIK